ncbi:hypothetical protein [Rathayibacter iranicus]|uniref:Uncharacterized protein n=2 Tax=Rathayibacter iranicus TaxID=59737 RepID=A0AAD1EM75_9MICO|nr:hypothetical protein [Rathayibacter iranicus]AZZ55812.1 hypothetical protein C7V51_07940 [Rathayibacter iranicus]MWV30757.1 hypothetical protein [Rathayibacter iranicus NCPPB 2253 = VKM Ac-1602]PPI47581.1 hypothetical protein C5E09_06980 [Rathayibacter iranicus]PPI60426.1 hypothetical protein C5E08_07910 [Rathayibacter iranicus]PPI71915.1 hypothetical protein C5E01_06950 [Rathayibacter iranicus]
MIAYPRPLLYALGAGFSLYHVVLAFFSFQTIPATSADLIAVALYVTATVIALWPGSITRLSLPVAIGMTGISIALPLLVAPSLDPTASNGYATWYIAAAGTLMTIVCARRQPLAAWAGMAFLVVHTTVWAGPATLATLGVVGGVAWVAIAQLLIVELARAGAEARVLEAAERAAASWRAAEEAHLSEREVRLEQTRAIASDMLRRIADRGARLTEEDRRECRLLEASVRDEIRGRRLLDDDVRRLVLDARRRGVTVSVLDDGGLDRSSERESLRVLRELARALTGIRDEVDRVVVRTASADSPSAVTVVGLRTAGDGSAGALGSDDAGDEVDAWVEIRRDERRTSGG